MKQVEKTGRTVEEALELALIEMDLTEDDVTYEVIEKESKGLLGIFGQKEAKILVTEKENAHHKVQRYLEEVLEQMGLQATVDVQTQDDLIEATISGERMALLIGKRGKTIDALQYLASLAANRGRTEYVHVSLDSENYRQKRKDALEALAHRMAEKAKKQRKDIILNPMNSYERRIIHSALQKDPLVSTRSEGKDPVRKVIIFLNR